MKIKLAVSLVIPVLIMLGSAGCVTSTNSYTRDIVYRDGSYYSPADEQYGDYYYEPEPDYAYYDDNYYDPYYGFNSGYYNSSRYSRYDSRCRFSYHHNRYCDNRWDSSYLSFGGLTIIFGSSDRYGYGYDYGYGRSNYGYHNSYGNYPYHGSYPPRPRPQANHPIPMPKPTRQSIQTPDNNFSGGPNVRAVGEPTRIASKPGIVNTDTDETIEALQPQERLNPYTRTRIERRPNIRPEAWRNAREDNADTGIPIRNNQQQRPSVREDYAPGIRTKPALLIDNNEYQAAEMPSRQERSVQPYPRQISPPRQRAPTPIEYSAAAPPQRERSENNDRQERPAPRVRQAEPSAERAERAQPAERRVQSARGENSVESNGAEEAR